MSDAVNPYQAPSVSNETPAAGTGQATIVTDATFWLFGKAAPWAKFLGIMGFVGVGFLVLFSLILIVARQFPFFGAGMNLSGQAAAIQSVSTVTTGILYLGMAVLFFFPARYMFNLGKAMQAFKTPADAQTLEAVARTAKSMLKFYGIVTIVFVSISLLSLVLLPIATLTRY